MEENLSDRKRTASYSPLVLAFVGDGIYDLIIRTMVTAKGNRQVKTLHREKAALVNAHAQAQMAEQLMDFFTDEERDIYRRGRNTHSATMAKNQTVADYRSATGLEAVCGYLYMNGQMARLITLIEEGIRRLEEAKS